MESRINRICVCGLQGNLDIDGTLAINGILVQVRGDNVQLGEGFHVTAAVGTAQTLLDVVLLLLEGEN